MLFGKSRDNRLAKPHTTSFVVTRRLSPLKGAHEARAIAQVDARTTILDPDRNVFASSLHKHMCVAGIV